MLRSLLVGVNGSRWSQTACQIGIAWAAELHIPLTCMGVVDVPALMPLQPAPTGLGEMMYDPGVVAAEKETIKSALQFAGSKAEQAGAACRLLTREGSAAVMLGREAQRHDLLILGRHTAEPNGNGSKPSETLVNILRHAPRPVILASDQIPKSSHVVIAYDGSAQAARTLQSFVSSGLYHGHPLHLVGISNEPDQMNHILGRAVDFLGAHCLRAETHVLPVGASIAQSLIDFARGVPAGLMVIGVYGQPWYKELLIGSVTGSVLTKCPIPLFLDH